jgi:multicomponent Na+:H+ antiporter subunit E
VSGTPSPTRAALVRGAALFAIWIVLIRSSAPGDLALGVLASAVATWVSLRLVPAEQGYLRYGALLAFVPHFLWESVIAGVDVARRAFAPSMPLKPGFVRYPVSLPRGLARNTFTTITSLLPGSVPAGEAEGTIVYHCLDVGQPVVAQLSTEERALAKALVSERRDA